MKPKRYERTPVSDQGDTRLWLDMSTASACSLVVWTAPAEDGPWVARFTIFAPYDERTPTQRQESPAEAVPAAGARPPTS